MKTYLFIWLDYKDLGLPQAGLRWLKWAVRDQKVIQQGSLPLADLASLAPHTVNAEVLVLVPGEDCLHLSLSPPGTGKAAMRALPYMVEEKLHWHC